MNSVIVSDFGTMLGKTRGLKDEITDTLTTL